MLFEGIGSYITKGGNFAVYEALNRPDCVVKRMFENSDLRRTNETNWEPQEVFDFIRKEHELVYKFFGDEFVPKTEFVTLDTQLENDNPKFRFPQKEYLMIQKRVEGLDIEDIFWSETPIDISRELREKFEEFIARYNHMASTVRAVIEDQIVVNFETNEIHITDTNMLQTFDFYARGNSFFNGRRVSTSSDVLSVLAEQVPELSQFLNQPYMLIREDFNCYSELFYGAQKFSSLTPSRLLDFVNAVRLLDYFPPEGENMFIRRIRSSLDI